MAQYLLFVFISIVSFVILAMNIAANQAIYPQTATHLSYPNGAILPNPLQQTASLVNDRDERVHVCLVLIEHFVTT
jgi:hypothetical protein